MNKPKILVVGSMNMDLYVEGANRLPAFGESVQCGHYGYTPGGKGANQAVAVAKQGADVFMVGRVGDDAYGKTMKEAMESEGVHTDCVVTDSKRQTGLALMLINEDGGMCPMWEWGQTMVSAKRMCGRPWTRKALIW